MRGATAELEVSDDAAVLVTREPRTGSEAPTEGPVVEIPTTSS